MKIPKNEGSKKPLRKNPVRGNTPLTDLLEQSKLPLTPNVIKQAAIELEVAGIGIHFSKGSRIWFVPDHWVPATEKILRRLGRYHNTVFCQGEDPNDADQASGDPEGEDDYDYED